MSLEDGVREESRTFRLVRGMNALRIPLYLTVVWVQNVLLSEAVAADIPFDVLNVLVPLGLLALDVIMVTWSKDRKKGFGLAGFILSCLSLTAALNSLRQYPWFFMFGTIYPPTIAQILMIWLAMMVVLVSTVELAALLYESIQLPMETLESPSEIRTYET